MELDKDLCCDHMEGMVLDDYVKINSEDQSYNLTIEQTVNKKGKKIMEFCREIDYCPWCGKHIGD